MKEKSDIRSLSHSQLSDYVKNLGVPAFRTKQIESWLYATHCLSFDEMTNLPKELRQVLKDEFSISPVSLITKQISADGTRKYLLSLSDGLCVEAVGIPSQDDSRLTVCFSSQAGCPMRCSFCATGQSGFMRNLYAGEMFDQIKYVEDDFGRRVTNVVCMGQGEPFLNYNATIDALRKINSPYGLGIGARHITISTCGIIKGIQRLSNEPEQFTLAVSLHSALQETRDKLMPGVSDNKIVDLREEIKAYGDKTKRRPSLEYALIKDVNDDAEHIAALVDFCHGMLCHVNLIPLNPVVGQEGTLTMKPSSKAASISRVLNSQHIENSIRTSRGADIDGACGQLRQKSKD